MKKEITICDSCGDEMPEAMPYSAGPALVGEGKNSGAFSLDITFHPMAHGTPPRSHMKAGPAPDLCLSCAIDITTTALRARARKIEQTEIPKTADEAA